MPAWNGRPLGAEGQRAGGANASGIGSVAGKRPSAGRRLGSQAQPWRVAASAEPPGRAVSTNRFVEDYTAIFGKTATAPIPTPAPAPAPAAPVPAPPAPAAANPSGWVCGAKTTCGEMTSCEEAKFYLTVCGVRSLDGDGDGVPCEKLCR